LYNNAAAIAKQAQEIATNTRQVVEQARKAIEGLNSKEGPVQSTAAGMKQTMDDARNAMAAFAENMEALKHNFLVRGFFKDRGFFSLADISPAQYREGALTKGGRRRTVRVWLRAAVLLEPDPERADAERLTAEGQARLDSALAPFLDRFPGALLIVEGYSQYGTREDQYLRSRTRASLVRDYLIGKFNLDRQTTGVMPLGRASDGSPNDEPWDGVALALFQEKSTTNKKR
jgi:hypothetical protein